jgi:hypothetical protein
MVATRYTIGLTKRSSGTNGTVLSTYLVPSVEKGETRKNHLPEIVNKNCLSDNVIDELRPSAKSKHKIRFILKQRVFNHFLESQKANLVFSPERGKDRSILNILEYPEQKAL